jgi:transcriptional regulator with XRE-family HTH domain
MNSTAVYAESTAEDLGHRIARLRVARGWKQRELARRLEVSPSRLSRLERGSWPRPEELATLRRVFSVSLDELVLGDTPPAVEGEAARLLKQLQDVAGPDDWQALIFVLRRLIHGFRAQRGEGARP